MSSSISTSMRTEMKRSHAKRRRSVRNAFIDDIAGSDNDEYDNDEYESEGEYEIEEGHLTGESGSRSGQDGMEGVGVAASSSRQLVNEDHVPHIFSHVVERFEGIRDFIVPRKEPEYLDGDADEGNDVSRIPVEWAEDSVGAVAEIMQKSLHEDLEETDSMLFRVQCEKGFENYAILYLLRRALHDAPSVDASDSEGSSSLRPENLIRAAFTSDVPGYIYLEVSQWSPRNTLLRDLLHKTPGLLFPSPYNHQFVQRFRPNHTLGLPAAELIERQDWKQTLNAGASSSIMPERFVRVTRHPIYHGDVGLVAEVYRSDLLTPPKVRILLPSRFCLPTQKLDPLTSSDDNARATRAKRYDHPLDKDPDDPNKEPDPRAYQYLFVPKHWSKLGWEDDLIPRCRNTPQCKRFSQCSHAYIEFFGNEFEAGLHSITIDADYLEPADNISFDSGMLFCMAGWNHTFVKSCLRNSPLPERWNLRVGDCVCIVIAKRPEESDTAVRAIQMVRDDEECHHGCEGEIVSISGSQCTVRFDNGETRTVSVWNIRRLLQAGNEVECRMGENLLCGWILSIDESTWEALFLGRDPVNTNNTCLFQSSVNEIRPTKGHAAGPVTDTFGTAPAADGVLAAMGRLPQANKGDEIALPRRTETPWRGSRVKIVKHRGGWKETGIVRDVLANPNSESGVVIAIELDIRGRSSGHTASQNLQVDYSVVRDLDTGLFLHMIKPLPEDSWWLSQFHSEWLPVYSEKEQRELQKRARELDYRKVYTELQEKQSADGQLGGMTPMAEHGTDVLGTVWDPHDIQSPVRWLRSKLIGEALTGLRVVVDIDEGPGMGLNRAIELEYNGENSPYKLLYYKPHFQKRENAVLLDCSQLSPSTQRPKLKTEASLMIITDGVHMGKLVYRIGQRYVGESQTPENARLIVRVVTVNVAINQCTVTEEDLLVEESSLAIVNEDRRLRADANEKLKGIRKDLKNRLFLDPA